MSTDHDPAIDLLPRRVSRETPLVDAAIIHPAQPARYRRLAGEIAGAIGRRGHPKPACLADTKLLPERSSVLPEEWRRRPLIVLGNLNTNRLLSPLYANYLCSTDATFPGGDGHDLRTIVNPFGTGTNLILVGGSTLAGVEQATARLTDVIAGLERKAPLPWLLDVQIESTLAANLKDWPYTPLEDSAELQALRNRGLMFYTEPMRVIGAYTLMWAWTADRRYAEIAVEALRRLNTTMVNGYGDWHYLAERFLRAVPLLMAGGFLTDEEVVQTDRRLLLTALNNQDEWWRMRRGEPPLGHRHHGKGTYEFLLLARYLRDQANPTPALRAQCDRWIAECHAFLDGLARACIDDQDDESTLNNLATLYRYALGEERHEFFTSGNARRVAERCLALHDNNGNGAGQGGYGESQGLYLQQEATEQTACAAFYYGDRHLKWILQTLPNLEIAQRYVFLRYVPVFLQKYDTGPELEAEPPPAEHGVTCLPVTDHQFALSNRPPLHIEPQGHMVNAPETWELPEGVGLNRLPQERGFDKLVLRGGYTRDDVYLLLQGYQGGYRWQGHMQAANCIVRFFQAGHVWLVQNTSRHSFYDKNGLFISDGDNASPLPPIAERVALADFAEAALTVTRLSDYHQTDWTRHLFWAKPGDDFIVVIDHVAFRADGPYSLTCSWRTPAHAGLEGRRWRSAQGTHDFTLVTGTNVDATCEVDTDQGACSPYVLRQRRAGHHRAGEEATFQNLFYVRSEASEEIIDLHRLDECSALVQRNGQNHAWCGVALGAATPWMPDGEATAQSLWVDSTSFTLAGATAFAITTECCAIRSSEAINLRIDLSASALLLQPVQPAGPIARVEITTGDAVQKVELREALALPLSIDRCSRIAEKIVTWLQGLSPAPATPAPPAPRLPEGWESEWTYDTGTRVPRVMRDVRITANPLPINGAPDEMLDPVMPDGYSRETWIQWPRAGHYEVTLTLPQIHPVSALNILGDCIDDPTLRTFSPLPAGITVEVEGADRRAYLCPVEAAPDRRYKRYRDAENRLQACVAHVRAKVRRLRVRFPAPADHRPFVLHRLEVLDDHQVAPVLERWCVADLDGDGRNEIVLVNACHELIVLDADGQEQWRRQLARPVTHVSAQPIDPHGPPVLCVGLLGGDLHWYYANGSLRLELPVAQEFLRRKDCLQGWFNATHSIAIWRRDADGRGCLVLGGYAVLAFLDADGQIVGHSYADGPWIFDLMVAPKSGDIYARCGWNHGIQYYAGVPGPGPSGEVYHLGGFNQPMFRMLKRVIPFINGRSLAAAWVKLPAPAGGIFFAAELGCGVLSTESKDWVWKREGGMSLNAACVGRLSTKPVALTGGQDGFLTAIDLFNGQTVRRQPMGAPVIGLAQTRHGYLFVATAGGVQTLDADWRPLNAIERPIQRLIPLDDTRLLICLPDHTLELLTSPAE